MEINNFGGIAKFRGEGQYSTMTIQPNTFLFDGHEFVGGNWGSMPGEWASIFDLAYRARRGDEAAIAVVNAVGIQLADINGTVYICRNWRGRVNMAQFRKKPVVIEAFRWTGGPDQEEDPVWIKEAINQGKVYFQGGDSPYLTIETLEGAMRASVGDWVIKGIKGEIYPCKPDIFAATYEAV